MNVSLTAKQLGSKEFLEDNILIFAALLLSGLINLK